MTLQFSGNLVGMKFHPPAAEVVNLLPGGVDLILLREPENPHDTNAIKVCIAYSSIESILDELFGEERQSIALEEDGSFFLGYIDRHTAEYLALQLDSWPGDIQAKLAFNLEGRPTVDVGLLERVE